MKLTEYYRYIKINNKRINYYCGIRIYFFQTTLKTFLSEYNVKSMKAFETLVRNKSGPKTQSAYRKHLNTWLWN